MVPALFSATGFAAYRGLLNTVTPLKVSLTTNLLNLVLDPLAIFGLGKFGIKAPVGSIFGRICSGLGASGAAAAVILIPLPTKSTAVSMIQLSKQKRRSP